MINPMDLSGKNIVVTGASSGIGRASAIQISKLGGRVVLIARNTEKLNKTRELLGGKGHAVYPFDLIELDKIEGLIKRVVQENGLLNGLVHCAGIAPNRPLSLTKTNFLHNVMLINFYSFVELVRCIARKTNYAADSSLIGISSIASKSGEKSKIAYSASKAALDSAVRCMAKELSEKSIRVNTIMPGWVNTEMLSDYMADNGDAPDAKVSLARQYYGITEPQEIANAVAYLLSDSAKTITGTSFRVDGGMLS